MGGAASAIGGVLHCDIDRDALKQLAPHHFSESLFEDLSGGEASISRATLSIFAVNATDLYLMQDWSRDNLGRSNQYRVSVINAHLRRLGIKTWFDEVEPMCDQGGAKRRTIEAINEAAVVVLFITQHWFDVISTCDLSRPDILRSKTPYFTPGPTATEELKLLEAHSKLEFCHTVLTKPSDHLIIVAMEQRCLDPSCWPENMRARLAQTGAATAESHHATGGASEKSNDGTLEGVSAIDYTNDSDPAEVAKKIYKRFKQIIPKTVTELLDDEMLQQLDSIIVSPHQIADASGVLKALTRLLERQDYRCIHELQSRRSNGNELARAAEIYALLKKTQGPLEANKTAAMNLIESSPRFLRWMETAVEKEARNAELITLCCVVLGECRSEGMGCNIDRKEALKWFEKAVSRNHPLGINALGAFYETEEADENNGVLAAKYYEKAAELGFAIAQCNLAWCYERGIGLSINYSSAAKWYRAASDLGCPAGMLGLASCYSNGTGLEKDFAKAAYYFRLAADHGSSEAQCMIGVCLLEGIGVLQDGKDGVHYLKRAAEQGHSKAMYLMGELCENGHTLVADKAQALDWYKKAANLGDEDAMEALRRLS